MVSVRDHDKCKVKITVTISRGVNSQHVRLDDPSCPYVDRVFCFKLSQKIPLDSQKRVGKTCQSFTASYTSLFRVGKA